MIREPQSRGYTLALTASFAELVAYIASIQQIVFEAFAAPGAIGLVFGAIAAPIGARFVDQFADRRPLRSAAVGHCAALALALALVGVAHAAIASTASEGLMLFITLQALTMVCFALTSANLSTLAMEHMSPIAGIASSIQGTIGTVRAALIGFVIGRSFDGTLQPFLWGTAACGVAAFLFVLVTEPRRLFARLAVGQGQPAGGRAAPPAA